MKPCPQIIRIFFMAAMLSVSMKGTSQDPGEKLVELFMNNNRARYQERIFVHLDRQYYLAGERIQFSIFCLEPASCKPSLASSAACIELLDRQNNSIVREKISLHRGYGAGSLEIPTSCKGQEYILRCYTAWQRNSGPRSYYYNNLLILHPSEPMHLPGRNQKGAGMMEMEVWPEGGQAVPGVRNRFVFRVSDADRTPVMVSGGIIRDDSVTVTQIQNSATGMGCFHLVPEKGREYTARICEPGGKQAEFRLPVPEREACAVELTGDRHGRRILFVRPHKGICNDHRMLILVIWRPSSIEMLQKMEADTLMKFDFHDRRFAPGIHHITLLDETYHILAERSFFVDGKESLEIRTIGLQESYNSRQTITFDLETFTPQGVSTPSLLSVSVSLSGYDLPRSHSNAFLQSILLGSEIPELLPLQTSGISPEQMDQYMIMHSRGKCNWQGNESRNIMYVPEQEGLVVSGKIIHRETGMPASGQRLFLSFIDTIPDFYSTSSNQQGIFHFSLDDRTGTMDVVIQADAQNEEDFLIALDNDFSREPVPGFSFCSLKKTQLQEHFEKLQLHRQLAGAYSRERDSITGGCPTDPEHRIPFYGRYDHQIVMEEFIALPVMEEVFRELGKRIFLVREEGSYHVRLLDLKTNRIIGNHPFYFIDGVPVSDPQILMELDPSLIHSIRLKSERYFMKNIVMDGIVDIRTLRGNADPAQLPESSIRQSFRCFSTLRNPVCAGCSIPDDPRIPLFLTTPCFETGLRSVPGNPASIRFIAPDSKGRYDIAVYAMDENGRIGQKRFTLFIK
ncbi:MAG: hypothetical protein R6U78_06425 [Bacteroidales bacterium]